MKHDNDTEWLHNPLKDDNTLYYRRRDGIIVEHMVRSATHDMNHNHFHPEYEIFLLLHGKRQIFYENHPYLLEEGNVALINSGRVHRTVPVLDDVHAYYERIILYINKEKIEGYDRLFPELEFGRFFQQHEGIYLLSSEERQQIMKMFETIMRELNGEQDRSRTLVDLTIINFFINFWRTKRPKSCFTEKSEQQQRKGRHSIAYKASEYILEHFCEDIPLEKLARYFSVSESYLSRSFKDAIGVGIREYINILRIRKAQEMLEESDYSVSQIAEAVGFDNPSYFGRVFQNHLAVSPSQYRKEIFAGRSADKPAGRGCLQAGV